MDTIDTVGDVESGHNTHVRRHLRNMVCNLENVLGDLQDVVGDLRVLVHQIDTVTNKLDERYGFQWRGDPEVTCTDTSPNGDTDMMDIELLPRKVNMQEWSPEIDFSFLNLSRYEHCSNWGKLLSNAIRKSSCNDNTDNKNSQSRDDGIEYGNTPSANDSREYKHFQSNNNTDYRNALICESTDDEGDISAVSTDDAEGSHGNKQEKRNFRKHAEYYDFGGSCGVTQLELNPFHVNCQGCFPAASTDGYCGIYEAIMESQLECVPNVLDSSDSEYESSDIQDAESSSEMSVSDEYLPSYDRDVNTWTSYTLMPLTDSSEECLSKTCSDVLNDNLIGRSVLDNVGFQAMAATV